MELSDPSMNAQEAAQALYEAPFVLMSHGMEEDPIFNYCNLKTQTLYEMNWEEYTSLPSRLVAEAVEREKRARLLKKVSDNSHIRNYKGVRITKSDKRFLIENAVVFNLIDSAGHYKGQSATFKDVTFL